MFSGEFFHTCTVHASSMVLYVIIHVSHNDIQLIIINNINNILITSSWILVHTKTNWYIWKQKSIAKTPYTHYNGKLYFNVKVRYGSVCCFRERTDYILFNISRSKLILQISIDKNNNIVVYLFIMPLIDNNYFI